MIGTGFLVEKYPTESTISSSVGDAKVGVFYEKGKEVSCIWQLSKPQCKYSTDIRYRLNPNGASVQVHNLTRKA